LLHSYGIIIPDTQLYGGLGLNEAYTSILMNRKCDFNQADVDAIKPYFTYPNCLVPTLFQNQYYLSGNCKSNQDLIFNYQSTQVIFKVSFKIGFSIDAILDSSYKIKIDVNSQPFFSDGYGSTSFSFDSLVKVITVNSNQLLTIKVTPTTFTSSVASAYLSYIFLAVQLKQIVFYNYKVLIHSYANIWKINPNEGSGLNDSYTTTLINRQYNYDQNEANAISSYFKQPNNCLVPTQVETLTLLSGNCYSNTELTIYYQSNQVILKTSLFIIFRVDAILNSSTLIKVSVNSTPYLGGEYSNPIQETHSLGAFQKVLNVTSNELIMKITPTNSINNIQTYISVIYLAVQL
ncbi:hypothetical protein ABPG73_008395, partial [Tetrahymena malaccensis]